MEEELEQGDEEFKGVDQEENKSKELKATTKGNISEVFYCL